MKFHLSSWLIAAASFSSFCPTPVDAVGGGLRSSPDRRLEGNAYGKWKKCLLLHKHIELEGGGTVDEVDCYEDETKAYTRLEASLEEKVKKDFKNGKAKSGVTLLNGDGTYGINGDGRRVLHVSDVDSITYEDFVPEHGRRLVSTGNKDMLALRVIAADVSTTASEAEISDSWFGTYGDPVNLKSQYAACSYGALQCNAASKTTSTGVAVSNGVHEVTISENVSGAADNVIVDAVVAAGNAALGNMQGQFDHVMLCLPPGTNGGWIAYAYINWYLSVYNDNWCTYVSGQMHEIGHNLGLAHSGETADYDDQTGMMGYSYSSDDGPKMCFNAAKNWKLGWYPDGEHTVANNFFEGKIKGLSDYGNLNTAENEIIMAKLNDSTDDWYVSFNRATGINSGTQEGANQVLVHKRSQGTGYAASTLVAKLTAGGTFNGIKIDGNTVPVTVISINTSSEVGGYAQVKIGNGAPTTSGPTPAPTPQPTAQPTEPQPTPNPTPQPTSAPTVPIDCTTLTAKSNCDAHPGICDWTGKNWKSGECVSTAPTTPSPTPPPTPPSPTTPSPTPSSPGPNCPVCSVTGQSCCGTCRNWGKPANRGCV